jgi:Ser/Thr protein kinase RdoA (MazF antagonist)
MPISPQLLAQACQLYQTLPESLIPLTGGFSNAVYKFSLKQPSLVSTTLEHEKFGVLRIGVEDCPVEQTLAMLEWVHFLGEQGAPVTSPLFSVNRRLLEHLEQEGTHYVVTAFEEVVGTLAERIPPADWSDELFRHIGKAVGKFHRISRGYHPSNPSHVRPVWFDSYEIQKATSLLADSSSPAAEILALLVSQLKLLPTSPQDFGLIHDDLHFANFLIQPDRQPIIIDFDDYAMGWFVIDVSMALFDVLVLFNPGSETEKENFARHFLTCYLSGYHQEHELSKFWQSQIPHFLKLKELCIYASLIKYADIEESNSWGGRFMRGRTKRIVNDIPYVEIDFTNL